MEWPAKVLHWQDIYAGTMFEDMEMPQVLTDEFDSVDGRTFRSIKLPPAETINATAFAMPDQKIFIGGDLLFEKTHLYMGDTCNARQWLSALDEVKADGNYDIYIPGHGDVIGDKAFSDTAEWLGVYNDVHQPGVHFTDRALARSGPVKRTSHQRLWAVEVT